MSKLFFVGVAVMLWVSGCTTEVPTEGGRTAGFTGGVIKFAQKLNSLEQPEGHTCSVDIDDNGNTWKYRNFRLGWTDCNNDVYSFFYVDNAPSAVTFHLRSDAGTDHNQCSEDKNTDWYFILRTVRQRTTTSKWISIQSLKDMSVNSIVDVGGLRLDGKKEHDKIEGKLSCVAIKH